MNVLKTIHSKGPYIYGEVLKVEWSEKIMPLVDNNHYYSYLLNYDTFCYKSTKMHLQKRKNELKF